MLALHPSPGFTPQISLMWLTGRIWHHREQPCDVQPGPERQPGEEDGDVWLHHGPHRGKSDTLVAITLCHMGFYFTCTSGKEPIVPVIVWKGEEPFFFFFAFNQSNPQSNSFYQVPKFVYHKEEKCKKLSEKRRAKKLLTLHLQTGGVESDDARVCSDQLPYVALFI